MVRNTCGRLSVSRTRADTRGRHITNKTEENEQLQSEIDELTAEKDSLLAEQGAGQQPQAQPPLMTFGLGGANQGTAQNGQQKAGGLSGGNSLNAFSSLMPSGNQNDGRLAEIESQIGSKTSQISSNSSSIQSAQNTIQSKTKTFSNWLNNVKTQATEAKDTAKTNTQNAQKAQQVGAITSTTGGVVSAVGAAMMAWMPTTFWGASVSAAGGLISAAGGATSTAAAGAQNDLQGMAAGTQNTLNSVSQMGQAVKEIKANKPPKTNTPANA